VPISLPSPLIYIGDLIMEIEQVIEQYLIKNNIPLKSKRSGYCVIEGIISGGRNSKNWSKNGFLKFTNTWFPDKPKGMKVLSYILLESNLNICSKCGEVKTLDNFAKNKNKVKGFCSWCSDCHSRYYRDYYSNNKGYFAKKNILRKIILNDRTPKWADLKSINIYYSNCPEGYHVDHIIPLRGEKVSGLHVLDNLQYLPAKENLSKGNKFNGE
jgi:hypothetical protein